MNAPKTIYVTWQLLAQLFYVTKVTEGDIFIFFKVDHKSSQAIRNIQPACYEKSTKIYQQVTLAMKETRSSPQW